MNKSNNTTVSTSAIRIEDLVRFLHPLTGEKEIGLVVQKKLMPSMKIRRIDPYIKYGIICRRELIWITSDNIYELERIEV